MADSATVGTTLRRLWQEAWQRPQGRWPALRWGLGLLLPLALVLWGLSALIAPDDPAIVRVTVNSQVTGEPIAGASVVVDGVRYLTDSAGIVTLDPLAAGTGIAVSAPGHESASTETTGPDQQSVTVSLNGVLIVGGVTDIVSGNPVEGTEVTVLDSTGAEFATTRTDEAGGFVFKFVPENASLVVSHDVYGEYRQEVAGNRSLHIQLAPPPVTGRIVDANGNPVAGAMISVAQAGTVTDREGVFVIEGAGQGLELTADREGVGNATVIVDGTDLGTIALEGQRATPQATPPGGT